MAKKHTIADELVKRKLVKTPTEARLTVARESLFLDGEPVLDVDVEMPDGEHDLQIRR